jgi:preprotein translocase subunit SecD
MSKETALNKILKKPRVILLITILILSLITINFHLMGDNAGVAIRSVSKESAAQIAGIEAQSASPMSREVIVEMQDKKIETVDDYYAFTDDLRINQTFIIKTIQKDYCLIFGCLKNKENIYRVTVQPNYNITTLNETELVNITEQEFNQTLNKTVNITKQISQNKTSKELIGPKDIGLSVYPAPSSNIKKGLDLEGGTRVLLSLEENVEPDVMEFIIDNLEQRLNFYGLSDIKVREVSSFGAEQYIMVEIAGVNSEEVRDLISSQGKFEAKIGDKVVFVGGKDIVYVAKAGQSSRIESCNAVSDGSYMCKFTFAISLSPEAAKRQANITKNLPSFTENGQSYLNESLQLFLDDNYVDELRIASDLRGNAVTEIAISGSGVGDSEKAAQNNALANMKTLQTVLKTGSLPVKLNIEKTDTISPNLGKQFINNILLVGVLAILGVVSIIILRYRKLQISIPVIITMLSEVFILLGFAALVGWNLDIAAIAGILIAIGSGVDDQIVITDETLRKSDSSGHHDWKKRFKKAFFIVLAAYATTMVAMVPLLSTGAGIVKGFAITTMAGVTIGVFITRRAFAQMIKVLLKK